MSKLLLPAPAVEGLLPLAKLSLESATEIVRRLRESLAVSLSVDDDIANVLRGMDVLLEARDESADAIASAVYGLHFLRLSGLRTDSELASQIAAVLAPKAEKDPAEIEAILLSFLELKMAQASVKAWSLLTEFQNIYLRSRVITDIRPVFADDLATPLNASLIVHTLKFTVRTGDDTKELFLAADSEDLRNIIAGLQRGLEKAEALKQIIKGANQLFGQSLEGSDGN